VEVRHAAADRKPGNLRAGPLNGKCNGRVTQHAKIIGLVRVFPDVFAVQHKIFSKGLLETGMEFIAPSWTQRRSCDAWSDGARHERGDHLVVASQAGKHQVLIERRFQRPGIGDPQHGAGGLDVVSDAEAWLRLIGADDTVVMVEPESKVEGPVLYRDAVLEKCRQLSNVGVAAEPV